MTSPIFKNNWKRPSSQRRLTSLNLTNNTIFNSITTRDSTRRWRIRTNSKAQELFSLKASWKWPKTNCKRLKETLLPLKRISMTPNQKRSNSNNPWKPKTSKSSPFKLNFLHQARTSSQMNKPQSSNLKRPSKNCKKPEQKSNHKDSETTN